jgi:deazaflavin-dependent oxidoreductase (nitroreductase family)
MGWGPVIGRFWVVLTTTGRKSGMPVHTVLGYYSTPGRAYVVSGWGRRSQWYRNLATDPTVTLQKYDGVFSMHATPVSDPEEIRRVCAAIAGRTLPLTRPHLHRRETRAAAREGRLPEGVVLVRLESTPVQGPPPLRADLKGLTAALAGAALGLAWLFWRRRR